MGQRKGALMINSAKSSGFLIPMALGLSRCHVTCLGHFRADWGKLVSKHRCFGVGSAVRDNHKHHQLCLPKLAPVFASIFFPSWRFYFLSPASFAPAFHYSHTALKKKKEERGRDRGGQRKIEKKRGGGNTEKKRGKTQRRKGGKQSEAKGENTQKGSLKAQRCAGTEGERPK